MGAENQEDVSSVVVSAKVMAELLGVSDRHVRKLAEEGILERNSHGRYLITSIRNYIMTLRLSKAGDQIQEVSAGGLDLSKEKAKHEIVKRSIAEIRLQLIKNQVHKSEDVKRVMTDMLERFKSKLLAIPAMAAPKLIGKSRDEIQEYLRGEIESALFELSSYNPATFYSDEYIDVSDGDVFDLLEEGDGDHAAK